MLYCVIMVLKGVVSIANTALGSASCCIDHTSYHYNAYSTRFRTLSIIYIYVSLSHLFAFSPRGQYLLYSVFVIHFDRFDVLCITLPLCTWSMPLKEVFCLLERKREREKESERERERCIQEHSYNIFHYVK